MDRLILIPDKIINTGLKNKVSYGTWTQRNLNPSFMNQIFVEDDTPYTHRSGRNTLAPQPNTTGYGIENARFLGAKIWHTMPTSLKESHTLNNFKRDIKKYKFECNCRLCKRFVQNLGFL